MAFAVFQILHFSRRIGREALDQRTRTEELDDLEPRERSWKENDKSFHQRFQEALSDWLTRMSWGALSRYDVLDIHLILNPKVKIGFLP